MPKWFWTVLFVVIFIVLGGAREIIFVNINEQIEFNEGRQETYRVLDYLSFLHSYSSGSLTALKWILTFVFSAVHLGCSLLVIKLVLRESRAFRWLISIYIFGLIMSAILFIFGKISGQMDLGYTIARRIMGALQSPFPIMVLIPALYLLPEGE